MARAAGALSSGTASLDAATCLAPAIDLEAGAALLKSPTDELLGNASSDLQTRTVVTMPAEAATDFALVRGLVEAKMDCARINCAHDDPSVWLRMIENIRRTERLTQRRCKVLMDLAGPKIRTGPVESPAEVVKVKPQRDAYGAVTAAARIWLYAVERPEPAPLASAARIGTSLDWRRGLRRGMVFAFKDARGAKRTFAIADASERGAWALLTQTAYIVPPTDAAIDFSIGDRLIIAGSIVSADTDRLLVRIERTPAKGGKLRADKGINLPQSELKVPALSSRDMADVQFIAKHADIVALSLVNSPDDVALLPRTLANLNQRELAVVAKIETRRAFRNLSSILLALLRSTQCGVMIARGDLAVECGFERLEEEILWLCEAAHLPVIWATQVLENLAKKGLPSRAEITDAAMSNRAECVMLNKGPHVIEAVRALRGILRRMQSHQQKKRSMLRELELARGGFDGLRKTDLVATPQSTAAEQISQAN
jgi:pyruvate kinase